jgi:hypothetical protein
LLRGQDACGDLEALRRRLWTGDATAQPDASTDPTWPGSSSDVPEHWQSRNALFGLMRSDFLQWGMRWCPVCLAEIPYLRREWRLKLCCVCVRHACVLRDTCHVCGLAQRMERVDIAKCPCGARLDSAILEETTPMAFVDLTAFFTAAVFSASPVARDWLRLVRYLGAFSEEQPRPRKPGQTAHLHDLKTATRHVDRAARLLQDWPRGLWSLLDKARESGPSSDCLGQAFGPIYPVLYRHLAAPCFQFLRDEFEAYLHGRWWGLLCRRNRSFQSATIEAHPRLSIKQAAQQARTTSAKAEQCIQQSQLDLHASQFANGKQRRTVPASFVSTLSATTSTSVTLRTAADTLALPAERVRQLLGHDIGALAHTQPVKNHLAGTMWRIDTGALAELNLLGGVRRVGTIGPAITLKKFARQWRLTGREFCAFVQALQTRSLDASGSSHTTPLGDKLINKAAAKLLMATLRRSHEGWMSVDQAAQMLKIKQQVAYQLVRTGLLASASAATRGRRVQCNAVEQFRKCYVSLAEIARVRKESPKICLTRLTCKPICGPSIDGSRQYFYRRAEVPHPGYRPPA